MDLRHAFLQHLRGLQAPPPERPGPSAFTALVDRLWGLLQRAALPLLQEEDLRRILPLLDPELRALAGDCVELLERRPVLGAPVGLTAAFLKELLQLDLQLSRLSGVAADLSQQAMGATAALWGALGAWNARVLLCAQERIADPSVPFPERHHIQGQFRGALGEAEQKDASRTRAERTALRKADALRQRVEAAGKSRAVQDALTLLRRLGGEGQGGQP